MLRTNTKELVWWFDDSLKKPGEIVIEMVSGFRERLKDKIEESTCLGYTDDVNKREVHECDGPSTWSRLKMYSTSTRHPWTLSTYLVILTDWPKLKKRTYSGNCNFWVILYLRFSSTDSSELMWIVFTLHFRRLTLRNLKEKTRDISVFSKTKNYPVLS